MIKRTWPFLLSDSSFSPSVIGGYSCQSSGWRRGESPLNILWFIEVSSLSLGAATQWRELLRATPGNPQEPREKKKRASGGLFKSGLPLCADRGRQWVQINNNTEKLLTPGSAVYFFFFFTALENKRWARANPHSTVGLFSKLKGG